jgi:hypothetical protein
VSEGRATLSAMTDNLEGRVVVLPEGARAVVESHRGEYDDDTTLRYLDGPHKESLTDRDTFAIRRYLKEQA